MTITTRLLFTGLIFILSTTCSYSQQSPVFTSVQGRLIRTTPRLADIDKNSMYGAPLKITRKGAGFAGGIVDPERGEERIFRNAKKNSDKPNVSPGFTPSLNAPTSSINLNQDGQLFPGFTPSDNNMAVGPNHIIQITNHSNGSAFKIWNKSGGVVQNSIVLSTITGVTGSGDPVVLYDQLADRWVLTEFGLCCGVSSYINTLIIAVSASSNPTGSWNVYSYNIGTFFVDYPKYAVWQNAYYATSNDFNTAGSSYLGSSFYAFDRNAMLAGASSATMIRTRLNNPSQRYYSMAPVCMEGPNTSNQSGLFAFLQDNTWVGGGASDSIFVFEFTPNFSNPASSVMGPFRAMKTQLPYNTNTGSLDQPGTNTNLDALSERLMNKVIYRNFGSSESIVCNTTDLQGTGTGVHWWELRRPESGNWNIYQEGFWHPNNDNRFMGAIAINANGDIGLLYNVVSGTVYPSARFTGRSSCDPAGQMTLSEQTVIDGTTYEGEPYGRYGDYNSLSIDPVNGSYWGTAQYNAPNSGTYGNWRTRLVNFTLTSSCGGGGNPGTVSGTSPLCPTQTTTYTSDGDPGGTWSSSNTAVATVNSSSGLVTAVSGGTANITYTVGGNSSFKTLTVNPNPNPGTVSGASSICNGATTTFTSNGDPGGTWGSDNTNVATVDPSTGLVTGVSNGTANISYSVTNSCGTNSSSKSILVADNPTASITCPANITNQQNGKNKCSAIISTPNPNTSGNCSVTSLSWSMTGAVTASGNGNIGTYTFPVGITTITYAVTNGSGSTATCSFTVTVKNKLCPGSPGNAPEVITGEMNTGNNSLVKDQLNVKVFPNPSETYFTLLIESGSVENVEIAVYAVNGKMIQKLKGNVYDVYRFGDNYSKGSYIVKVKQGLKQATVKLVK